MEMNDFRKHYIRIKRKSEEILGKKETTTLEKMFIHEIRGTLQNQVMNFAELYRNKIIEYSSFREIINKLKIDMPKYIKLEELTDVEFSEKGLRNSKSINLYDLFHAEKKNLENKYKLNLNINGHAYQNLNEAAITALISTHIGDAAKWTPKNNTINVNLSEENNYTKINIENPTSEKIVRPEFGLGKGIGTRYTKTLLDALDGRIEQKSHINENGEKIYKKEFLIPIKRYLPTLHKN